MSQFNISLKEEMSVIINRSVDGQSIVIEQPGIPDSRQTVDVSSIKDNELIAGIKVPIVTAVTKGTKDAQKICIIRDDAGLKHLNAVLKELTNSEEQEKLRLQMPQMTAEILNKLDALHELVQQQVLQLQFTTRLIALEKQMSETSRWIQERELDNQILMTTVREQAEEIASLRLQLLHAPPSVGHESSDEVPDSWDDHVGPPGQTDWQLDSTQTNNIE